MTTDFKKLSLFESAIISMIIVGALIIGFEFYTGMPKQAKVAIQSSSKVLDMHAVVALDVKVVGFVLNTVNQTYAAVNYEFTQVADISDQMGSLADLSERGYEQALAFVDRLNAPTENLAYTQQAQVLGASIADEHSQSQQVNYSSEESFGGYKKPDWQAVKNYISSFEINKGR